MGSINTNTRVLTSNDVLLVKMFFMLYITIYGTIGLKYSKASEPARAVNIPFHKSSALTHLALSAVILSLRPIYDLF